MDNKDRIARKPKLALIAGDAHPRLAEEIAGLIGTAVTPVCVSTFADGETRVRIEAEVQDADLYIVQPTSPPTNERLMSLALIADQRRTAAAHHHCRQRAGHARHPRSSRPDRAASCPHHQMPREAAMNMFHLPERR